jgi:peptidoglycan/xylan/chitin deacetylase (PgdA/CDA1 family)
MGRPRSARPLALAGGAAALALHAAPALTARDPLRRAFPDLAGVGAPGGVALTFDDGPHPQGTPAVLGLLEDLGWTATFFLLGSQVAQDPRAARAVVEAGHEVAVHGYTHGNHLLRSAPALVADLRAASDLITAATGVRPRWFRPPYGVLSGGSLLAARAAGLRPVLWTAWGRDWRPTTPAAITEVVVSGLREGGTILLHDSDCTSTPGSWRATAASLPQLARHVRAQGWAVRTLSDHLGLAPSPADRPDRVGAP